MLQSIRDRAHGLVVGVIVLFVCLTFALWGVGEYLNAGAMVVVAEANDEEINLREYQDALQRFRRQAQAMVQDAFNEPDWASDAVKHEALEQLVDDKLLAQLARSERMRISDTQVARELQKIPAFHSEEGFSKALYRDRVQLLGYSELGFEEQMRAEMVKAQLRSGIAASEFMTTEEARWIDSLYRQSRDIGYAILPSTEFDDQIEIAEHEVATYYEANRESYRTNEQVAIQYVELSIDALTAEVAVDDVGLREYYETNRAQFTAAEERNVNHILIQVSENAAAADVAAAREAAEVAKRRAEAGEEFEKLTAELSDDVGSRTEGGATDFFPRGVMAPGFEDAAFELIVGEISDPVRTRFGFHVIKLTGIQEGGLKTFEEVREGVEAAYREREAQRLFYEQAEEFSNLVYEHPDSLEAVADALALEIKYTDPKSRLELAQEFSERVAASAFDPEVLLEGLNSEPVELGEGRFLALRVAEHLPAAIRPLDEVRGAVVDTLESEQRRMLVAASGEALIARLQAGEPVADVMKAQGFDWKTEHSVGRESNDVNRAVLRAAFRLEVATGDVVYSGLPIGRGDYAVLRVTNVDTSSRQDADPIDVADIKRELVDIRIDAIWRQFVTALRTQTDVKLYPENL